MTKVESGDGFNFTLVPSGAQGLLRSYPSVMFYLVAVDQSDEQ